LQSAREWLNKLVPSTEALILVDEEQIRHLLKGRLVIPFLERDGKYWGPPPDDNTAIAELERLRSAGAKYLAFIWSTFWWTEHYPALLHHLREHCECIADNSDVLVFKLDLHTTQPIQP